MNCAYKFRIYPNKEQEENNKFLDKTHVIGTKK